MNAGMLVAALWTPLWWETNRATNRVMLAVDEPPPYRITGPLVSVITPAYNEQDYLPLLLAALKNQTYDNIEVIVVDNLSTDATTAVARSFGATVIINPDFNISKSRNMGARAAHGGVFVFIDADTIPQHTAIETIAQRVLETGAEMVHLNHCCWDSMFQSVLRVAGSWIAPEESFNGQLIAVSRHAFQEIGGFDETLLAQEGKGEDVDFIQRVMARWPANISFVHTVYSGTSARRQKAEGYIVPQHFQARAIRGGKVL
jgi:glycosyltransferase involved in cell wall biosynthesis